MEKSSDEIRNISEELDNWALIDLQVWSDYPEVDYAVDVLHEDLKATPDFKGIVRIRKRHIKVLILEFYEKWLTDRAKYSGYNLGSNYYSKLDPRYNKNNISGILIKVVDAMPQIT